MKLVRRSTKFFSLARTHLRDTVPHHRPVHRLARSRSTDRRRKKERNVGRSSERVVVEGVSKVYPLLERRTDFDWNLGSLDRHLSILLLTRSRERSSRSLFLLNLKTRYFFLFRFLFGFGYTSRNSSSLWWRN